MAKKFVIEWKEDGWMTIQEADAVKHVLEIMIFAENGTVTKALVRHNDGEEGEGKVLVDGKNALPMSVADFKSLFAKKALEFKA